MSDRNDTESGFTMIELLVVMAIIAVISGVVYVFFSQSLVNFLRLQSANITIVDRTSAINRMNQVLRGINRIDDAQDYALTAYTYFSPTDNVPSKVTYTYDNTTKVLNVSHILASGTAPNYTYNTSSAISRVVLRDIVLTGPLFSYSDRTGGTGPFSTATYGDIASIKVTINSTIVGSTGPTELSSTVLLRNKTGVQ